MSAAVESPKTVDKTQPEEEAADTDNDKNRPVDKATETDDKVRSVDGSSEKKSPETADDDQSVEETFEPDNKDFYLGNLRVDLEKDPSLNSTTVDRIVSIFQRNFAVNSILQLKRSQSNLLAE